MSHTNEEIASQPDCWRRALDIAATAPEALPLRGERVAVIGCGTSYYMAQSYAALREAAGQGETDAWPASELPGVRRRYDRVLALCRSGTTTEVLEALARVPAGTVTSVITATPGTPVYQTANHVLLLDFADEVSVVQTRFPTTQLVLLRAALGEDVSGLPALAEQALTEELPEGVLRARQITFLGTGWSTGIAHEAALKFRETSRGWTESYSAMEYRHGPVSIADHDTAVWVFGPAPEGLADQVLATGATLVLSTVDPIVDLIRAQRVAVRVAVAQGVNPDRPRGVTRSIILT
ncbi:SIS domain-containing protein [Kutzneria viridogrisea]|uniref:Sugar isomerase (SIS) n=2 Tax=Kutzneria TaxID=43356 RepID=W5WBB0_9PSEU|nr:SIS domain-containing protein [Kutzneria albida]AHH95509.1 sugar isomerase (SIS) [Kutzneria albida DSM 43870]MBA8927129.1 fructoselysine-6-P-deglycase FrlB-like protein [Kutzneria viridogrisea]